MSGKRKPEKLDIKITLTDPQLTAVRQLARAGLWGSTPAAVCADLIREGIIRAIRDKFLGMRSG
jgi:hypothetical protein